MRRGRGRRHLAPGAVAGVQQAVAGEPGQRLLVAVEALRLEHDLAVPVQAEGMQVGQVRPYVVGSTGHAVEVLDAQQEPATRAASEQPRQQGCPQVADVQRPGRAGGEATVGHGRHCGDRVPAAQRPPQMVNGDGGPAWQAAWG